MHFFAGTIDVDTAYYLLQLTETPSTRITVVYSVSYEKKAVNATMDIYTYENVHNIQKRCTRYKLCGQLGNKNLQIPLKSRKFKSGRCENQMGIIHCNGKIPVQDYKARLYFVPFGFHCDFTNSLKGLQYNISIIEQTNETLCKPMPDSDV